MVEMLPYEQYVARANRKRMAAGVLFRDRQTRPLLVEPSYKPNWEIPGGAIEADESPWATATREINEELALQRAVGRLLVVDHVQSHDSHPEIVVFVFDGGILELSDVDSFKFIDGEILSAGFYSMAEVRNRVKPTLANRLETALAVVDQGLTALCENGYRIA